MLCLHLQHPHMGGKQHTAYARKMRETADSRRSLKMQSFGSAEMLMVREGIFRLLEGN